MRIIETVTKYSFIKPQILTEQEYISYKQILMIEPDYDIAPKGDFWKEFSSTKWTLLSLPVVSILPFIWPPLGLITAMTFIFLMFDMISGTPQSMRNYNRFLNEKNNYFSNLKQIIITSRDYSDFKQKATRLQ